MKDGTKRLARLAILTALGTVLLILGSVLPAGRLALVAVSSLGVCVALMMYGIKWSLVVFLLTTALGTLLFPGASVIMYAAFFGYYPIAKSLFERLHKLWQVWACKFALYTFAFVIYWLLARALFTFQGGELGWYILYPLGAVVFWLYDQAYSSLIRFYIVKIARYFQ